MDESCSIQAPSPYCIKEKRDNRSRLVKSLTFLGHLNIQIDLGLFYVHIISVFQGYYPTFIHAQMEQNLLTL